MNRRRRRREWARSMILRPWLRSCVVRMRSGRLGLVCLRMEGFTIRYRFHAFVIYRQTRILSSPGILRRGIGTLLVMVFNYGASNWPLDCYSGIKPGDCIFVFSCNYLSSPVYFIDAVMSWRVLSILWPIHPLVYRSWPIYYLTAE